MFYKVTGRICNLKNKYIHWGWWLVPPLSDQDGFSNPVWLLILIFINDFCYLPINDMVVLCFLADQVLNNFSQSPDLSFFFLYNSYPPLVVVPSALSDDSIRRLAKCHRGLRFPAIVWRHPRTKALLLRSSGFHGKGVMGMIKSSTSQNPRESKWERVDFWEAT